MSQFYLSGHVNTNYAVVLGFGDTGLHHTFKHGLVDPLGVADAFLTLNCSLKGQGSVCVSHGFSRRHYYHVKRAFKFRTLIQRRANIIQFLVLSFIFSFYCLNVCPMLTKLFFTSVNSKYAVLGDKRKWALLQVTKNKQSFADRAKRTQYTDK